jgi:hypothetical protein
VVDNHAGPAGRHPAGVQVDIRPAKSGYLAAAHAGGSEQQPGGVQPVAANVVEICTELFWAPDVHLGGHALWQIRCDGGVAGEVAPAHRVPERGVQGAVDVADSLRCQPAVTVPMAGLEQRPVEGGELGRGEPLERKVAETRNEVSFDALLVAQPGRWPDPRPLVTRIIRTSVACSFWKELVSV